MRRLDSALAVGAFASLLARSPSLVPRTRADQALVAAGSAVMGGVAGAVTEEATARLARRLPGGRAAATGVAATASLAAWRWASRRGRRPKAVDAVETASCVTAVGVGVGGAAALLSERIPRSGRAYFAAEAGVLALDAGRAVVAVRRKLAEPRDRVKSSMAYDYLPSVSGGRGSLAPLETLDREGRKFLGLATPQPAIEELMGAQGQNPIRVYVGLGTASTPDDRVRLAVAELERIGAFRRRRMLVACPTGSGFVNPVFVEAEEYMSRGDVASVAVQYNDERSHRSLQSVPVARDTYRLLLETLRVRLDEIDPPERPEVAFYGESLGAWVGAEMLAHGGLELLDDLRVARGVLLGIPHAGAYELVQLARKQALPDSVGVFATAEELANLPRERRARLRYVIVTHPEDPVANYTGPQLVWRRPFWLKAEGRSPRIPSGMRWMPGITFLQVLLDVKNATSFTPVFEARAHDYRAEHPGIVRIAFGHDDVSDEQARAVAERTAKSAAAQWARERGGRLER